MVDSKKSYIDATIRHRILLLRQASGTFAQILPFLQKTEAEIALLLLNVSTVTSKARLDALIKNINEVYTLYYNNMNKTILTQAKALIEYEAKFTKSLVDKNITFETVMPSTKQLEVAAFTTILSRKLAGEGAFNPEKGNLGRTIQEMLEAFKVSKIAEVTQRVRMGFATGEVTGSMVTALQEQSPMTKRQAKTIVLTTTNHLANQSHMAFYNANADIVTGYQVVATLDNRTTLTCASLDGLIFAKDIFEPPPYHWNCRTVFISVFDPELMEGNVDSTRPAMKADGSYESVSSKVTYDKWLRKQSKDFIDEILSKEKGKLFRNGLNIRKFVDENHTPISLDELKELDARFN